MSKIEYIGQKGKICPLISTPDSIFCCKGNDCALWNGIECSLRRDRK